MRLRRPSGRDNPCSPICAAMAVSGPLSRLAAGESGRDTPIKTISCAEASAMLGPTNSGRSIGGIMRAQHDQFETHHLTCLVCGALPGTACVDRDFQELQAVHESRRMPVSERNWRLAQGWQPPELADERRARKIQNVARAVLFDPRRGSDAHQVRRALRRRRQGYL